MIKAGDYVVHSMEGVCKVKAIVDMPKGRERVSYYQLTSWPDEKTTVYVPVKTDPNKGVRLRKILSKDEVRDVFQSMIGSEIEWISDIGARQEWMLNIMKEGNPYDMACMTKMLTKKELAEKLNVSIPTIDRLLKDGIPRIYIRGAVRFDYDEVVRWLKERGK